MQPIASEQHTESRAAKTIRDIFESGRPVTYIRSAEEQRVAKALRGGGFAIAPLNSYSGLDVDAHRRHASRGRIIHTPVP